MIDDRFANFNEKCKSVILGQEDFSQIQYGKHENDTRIYTTTIGGRQTCKSNE